ncbi:glycosyl transferase [Kaistia sp. 32K]|uniref:glycosyltransferase family 2 protein n=1 Tax=Kaistia sp. 32K TaxID=2795690 RepID=UPI001938F7D7|nr:glycosyltransferase family 2 protein [Kaistia sp. 32K]BCP56166.1 glycosyl transferase [Kaistia sp. 32K]
MKLAVGIATTGRREALSQAVAELAGQTRPADRVVICAVRPEDVDAGRLAALGLPLDIRFAMADLPRQRNAILDQLAGFDAVLFLDDDFLVRPDYLAAVEAILAAHADVVLVTGTVLADGARNAGIPFEAARAILAASSGTVDGPAEPELEAVFGAYGCNMAVRLAPVFAAGLRFNENLPLYGWLEDLDFSRRIARHGRVVRSVLPRGVHMAIKSGRVSGRRYGYSQVANPVDLYREGLIPLTSVLSQAGRNLASNLVRSLAPEAHIDRRGRLRGNFRALADLARGRLSPRAILDM